MSESEARSPQSASLSTVPEDLKASIANMFLGLKDELMQHVEDCVAMATQDHMVHDADQDEEGVDSAGLQLLTGKSQALNRITKRIWLWAIDNHNWLSAAHKPGQLNVTADTLSRHFEDGIEWQLNPQLFDRICRAFGTPQVDLFASRINHLIPIYASWKPDPSATYVDAFSINWSQFANSYAFPPFCLIARCLQKIVLEQATVILLVPCWHTQMWFTRLLSLLIDQPLFFQVTQNVLTHPLRGNVHPLSPKLHLLACKVSGNILLTARFQQTLPACSCTLGAQAPISNTMSTLKSGPPFVFNGRLIRGNRMSIMC